MLAHLAEHRVTWRPWPRRSLLAGFVRAASGTLLAVGSGGIGLVDA